MNTVADNSSLFSIIDFSQADWVSAGAATAALIFSIIGVVIAGMARSDSQRANAISSDANAIASKAASDLDKLEKTLALANHELEEFRHFFTRPLYDLLSEIELFDYRLNEAARKGGFERAIKAFESEVWDPLHRKIRCFLIRSIENKYLDKSVMDTLIIGPQNPTDEIFTSLNDLSRSKADAHRERARQRLMRSVAELKERLVMEKTACVKRVYSKFGFERIE